MVEPVTPLGANHTSLRLWAAYAGREKGELQSEAKPVALPAAPQPATLETVPQPATLEMASGLHVMTCKCTLCSGTALDTIPSPVSGAKIVSVNLSGALSDEEKETVAKLRQRDAQVRRHEQAHLMAAGQHAIGGAQYTYQVGPDGQRYAIGGEVQIDMAPVEGDPEATLQKAQQLQQAALAPIDPSAADRAVAGAAARMAQKARQEIVEERQEEAASQRAEATEQTAGDPQSITPPVNRATQAAEPAAEAQSDSPTHPSLDVYA